MAQNESIEWSYSGGIAAKVWGLLLMFIGIMSWSVAETDFDRLIGFFVVLFFGGLGLGLVGFNSKFVANSNDRRIKSVSGFFGYVTSQTDWDFEDFSQIKIETISGVKGGYMSRTLLLFKANNQTLEIYLCRGKEVSEKQVTLARRLAEMIGIPVVQSVGSDRGIE